jgi:hypothetical protein
LEDKVSYDDPDVYYSPDKFNLEQVAQIDYSDGSYQFDYRVVWRHKDTGKLYTARDSGCSCPSPFEDYVKIEDLEEFSLSKIETEAREEAAEDYYEGDSILDFLEVIRKL